MARWLSDSEEQRLRDAGRLKEVTAIGRAETRIGNCEPVRVVRTASGQPVTTLYPLVNLCRMARIAEPIPEYKFHPTRKWRADYCWPTHMLMLEVNGGVWTQGRHTRGKGAIADMEKASEAAILGWRVLYVVPDDIDNGVALDRIVRALSDRSAA